MKRVVHKSRNFREAELWDIRQCVRMSVEERQTVARELRRKVYGSHCPDVREGHPRS